ncbi:MAG: undecaprenyl-diphosphate phosphatase [Patescibacteria group bacterium]
MSIWQVLILSLVQGITEFLPVSSSGHLILLPKFFNWADQGLAFDTIMHLATLLAVIIFFRKKIWRLVTAVLNPKKNLEKIIDRKLAWLILLASLPAGFFGFFLADFVDLHLRSSFLVALNLIFWAVILFVAEKYNFKFENKKNLKDLNWKDSLFIGFFQACALIPGTSRSGSTISAALFDKISKKDAIEFSFLIGIPIIAGAGLTQLFDLVKNGLENISVFLLGLGFLIAFISGLLAIKFLLQIVEKFGFLPFVIYRIFLAIVILFVL